MADKLASLSTQQLLERAYQAIDNSRHILLEFARKVNAFDDLNRRFEWRGFKKAKKLEPSSED